jgi:hypothetical protein
MSSDQKAFVIHYLVPAMVNYLQSGIKSNGTISSYAPPICTSRQSGFTTSVTPYRNQHVDVAFFFTGYRRSSVTPTSCETARAFAWSAMCMEDQFQRSYIIVLCPRLLNTLQFPLNGRLRINYRMTFLVVLHEMIHGLGFGNRNFCPSGFCPKHLFFLRMKYDFYLDPLKFPKALAAAQQHFGCEDMENVELSQDGSHLHGRNYNSEIMAPSINIEGASISPITIAILQDLGWKVEPNTLTTGYSWGKNMGCKFVLEDV